RLIAQIASEIARPRGHVRVRVVSYLKHVPGRRARRCRVRVIARVRYESVSRVRGIDIDAAHEPRRLRRGVDAMEVNGVGSRVRIRRYEDAAPPRADPERPVVARSPLGRDDLAAGPFAGTPDPSAPPPSHV